MSAKTLSEIDNLNDPVRLILGYRSEKKVSLIRVPLAQNAQDAFKDIAEQLLQSLTERTAEEWDPTRAVSKETYLVTTPSEVGDVPQVTRSKQPLIDALIESDSIEEVDKSSLRKADPLFYAYQFGAGESSTVFLRRMNALRGLRKKRLGILSDQLQVIDDPILAFDGSADLVFTSESVFVLSQSAFTTLFRGQAELRKMVRNWVDEIKKSTPMTEGSVEVLLTKSESDTRVAKRIESIKRRGHLANISPDLLRTEMMQFNLDPKKLMNPKDELVISKNNALDVLKFLNEDMFRGVLSDELFESDSKKLRSY
ncbi:MULTISPECIES: Kiwa anti-phage protein KwaB-like domain-containing protein [Corynebacterium]|uniref:Kiwa anti-phage protein KwaB-like domain-containing protein n=1 Tax=Corynebacterium TaxID=1716 RepID=UPI0008A5AD26|nr:MULTISPECIES: Kiwa anti-phage protein KwaB-like domain-containing protein [Corynebacterium]MCT1563138.1 DUF4868 domain-containing protein [Corynebacterium glucuronolyticum]OFO48796.1 hypothetical protein HMPREF3044_08180 [Corynebacterium sp. HMSC073D01]